MLLSSSVEPPSSICLHLRDHLGEQHGVPGVDLPAALRGRSGRRPRAGRRCPGAPACGSAARSRPSPRRGTSASSLPMASVATRVVSVWNARTSRSAIRRMYSACFSGSRWIGCVIFQIGSPRRGRLSGSSASTGRGSARPGLPGADGTRRTAIRVSMDRTACRYSSSLRWSARPSLPSQAVRHPPAPDRPRSARRNRAGRWRISLTAAVGPAMPVGHDRLAAAEHALEDQPRVGLVRHRVLGAAERIHGSWLVRPNSSDGRNVCSPDHPRRRLVDRHRRRHLAARLLLDQRRPGQVQEGAMLVAVEVLAPAALRQARQHQHVALDRLQRPQDRRQLAERPLLLRLPRLQDRAAGDGEDAHAQRRLARRFAGAAAAASSLRGTAGPAAPRREHRPASNPTAQLAHQLGPRSRSPYSTRDDRDRKGRSRVKCSFGRGSSSAASKFRRCWNG